MSAMREETLGGGITAFVSDAHSFGTDAILLADFASPKANSRVCDLGSGCGVIPLLWCRAAQPPQITAVELQAQACDLLRQAVERNRLHETLRVLHADLRKLEGLLPFGGFDLVTMNPPYQQAGTGIPSRAQSALLARHDSSCSFADACGAARQLLRFSGRLAMCCRPERLVTLLLAMHEAGIEPKRLRLVAKRSDCAPWLALVEGRRGGKPGLQTQALLCLYEPDGRPSAEHERIYELYAKEAAAWQADCM